MSSTSQRNQIVSGHTLPRFCEANHRQIVAPPHIIAKNNISGNASPRACKDESLEVPLSSGFAHAIAFRGKSGYGRNFSKTKPIHVPEQKMSLLLEEHLDTGIKRKGSRLPSYYNIRSYVTRSDCVGSRRTTQTMDAARTRKDKGKSVAFPLSGPSISVSSDLAKPSASICTVKKSFGDASKKITSPKLISDTSGKLGASYCFPMNDAVDIKRKDLAVDASKLINEKSLKYRMKKDLAGYIIAEEETGDDHLPKLVGTRCQLCNLDLALTAKACESFQANKLPTVAVLPCGHCYHNLCSQGFFGLAEPPCIACLDC